MGKTRSSAFVFAAAYIALVVGLFLALGGAAYAQSPSSASDQYDTKVKGVKVSATAGGNTASAAAEAASASEHRSLAPRRRGRRRRTRRRRSRAAAARAAQELDRLGSSLARQALFARVQLTHPVVRGGPLGAACDLCEPEPRDPVVRSRRRRRLDRRGEHPPGRLIPRRRHRGRRRARRTRTGAHAHAVRPYPPSSSPRERLRRAQRKGPDCRRGSRRRRRSTAPLPAMSGLRARSPRPRDAPRSEATRPAPPASRAVSVTPTISQCQSKALAAAHAANAPTPVATKRWRRARTPPTASARSAPSEERQPDEAELGERLHVERVPVAHDEQVGTSLVPEVLERSRAVSDQRTLAARVPRDAKLLAPAVSGDAEEPVVEIDTDHRVGVEASARACRWQQLGPPTATRATTTVATATADERDVERSTRASGHGEASGDGSGGQRREHGRDGCDCRRRRRAGVPRVRPRREGRPPS